MRKRPRKDVDVHNGFGEWGGYMDAKKSKLEEQFAEDALKNPYKQSNLFAGISIFVNGLTNPSAEELKRIMMTHGGIFNTYQRRSTTFIIASNLPDVKVRQITTAKIISPQWVVDCLKQNKILDYSNYLLYTNCKVSQPKILFKKKEAEDVAPKAVFNEATVEQTELADVSSSEPSKLDIVFNLGILNTVIRREEETKTTKIEPVASAAQVSSAPPVAQVAPVLAVHVQPASTTDRNEQHAKNEVRKGHARTAVDPNFLSEFYNNSRLHHIATLGASFKHHISRLREAHNGHFPARDQLKHTLHRSHGMIDFSGKAIMHIDMDCFFVSVGLRTRPNLKGFPIAVTHSKGHNGNNLQNVNGVDRKKEMELYIKRREEKYQIEVAHSDNVEDRIKTLPLIDNTVSLSEIASCSYEARKMGVKNGMFVGAALKLCPQLKTIPYDFDAYKEVAHILYDTITQYTMDVEAVSCDEMYVNLTEVLQILQCSVEDFVAHVRNEIIEKTQCPCSAGVGENKLQARMATKKAKPNGQYHLKVESVEEYFGEIPISDLPGVGFSTTQKCNNLNLKTCWDLQGVPLHKLQLEFGKKMGETLYQNCRGIDNKPLTYDQVRKSVSAEVNYGIRFTEEHELDNFLHQLCAEVRSRLNEITAKGKTITLKYMVRAKDAPVETAKFMGHGFCDNVTKSVTLATYTCDLNVITQTVFNIKNILNVEPKELRGIGIQINKLNTAQNEGQQKNTLKNMFKKVQAKQKLQTVDAAPFAESKYGVQCADRSGQKSTFRKVKSFNGTPTQHMGVKPELKNSNQKHHKIYEELDLSVLAELPHDIREEILREKDRVLNANAESSSDQKPKAMKKALVRKLENDFQDDDHEERKHFIRIPSDICISEENILKSKEGRHILGHWLENSGDPIDCDVEIITKYFKEFAQAQKLSELLPFVRYLHRKIEEMDCLWHRVYYGIVSAIQNEMRNGFGSNVRLSISESFDCKKCLNKM